MTFRSLILGIAALSLCCCCFIPPQPDFRVEGGEPLAVVKKTGAATAGDKPVN